MAAPERPGECLIELLDVESLEVQVLVDKVTDSLSINPDTVRSELACLLQAGTSKRGGSMCCAHHGFSLVLRAHTDRGIRTQLFDTGPEGYTVRRNGKRLGVAFGEGVVQPSAVGKQYRF